MDDEFEKMATEADRYADTLSNMNDVDTEIIRYGLTNEYDVIVSEALDFILNKNLVLEFKNDIMSLMDSCDSYLVVGRLSLCAAISGDVDLVDKSRGMKYDKDDDYFRAWDSCSGYFLKRDPSYLSTLKSLTKSSDNTVSSISFSLIDFINHNEN